MVNSSIRGNSRLRRLALERNEILQSLGQEEPFLVIVGGGITGASIARDAARRGIRVLLVERDDFASGTSGRSSKLVHGGFRYLQQYDFGLVVESTHERAVLQKIAGHLVRPLPFIYPVYKGDEYGFFRVSVGMVLYEILSGFQSHRFHRMHRRKKLQKLVPGLRSDELTGGALYYDAWTHDSVLTLACIQDAVAHQALCFNHMRYTRPVVEDGVVRAVKIEDEVSGRVYTIPAHTVVYATGPFTDEVLEDAGQKRSQPILRPTKGTHLVVARERLPVERAIAMHSPTDGRIVFAIPWGTVCLIGTTDTDFQGDKQKVSATSEDVDYLLETANHFFPGAQLSRADVGSTFAALRPLVHQEGTSAYQTSREHSILWDEAGFLTICGGKLTTCRAMAEELVDTYLEHGGRERHHHLKRCETALRPIWGGDGMGDPEVRQKLAGALRQRRGLAEFQVDHLIKHFGEHVLDYIEKDFLESDALEVLVPGQSPCRGEVDLAVLYGLARSTVDILKRRTTLFYKDPNHGLSVATYISERIAQLLGFDADWVRADLAQYQAEVELSRDWQRQTKQVA
jgi:glycerol-3-phosphate dehydrogenase